MEEYLIFAAIGGLLFLTLFINSVTEAYEQKQREKRIKILKIKQGMDELSDLLERLNGFGVANEIRDLLLNEIMARLQTIQSLDRHFKGIQALIEQAKEESGQDAGSNAVPVPTSNNNAEFTKNLMTLQRLIKRLNVNKWYSRVTPQQLQQFVKDTKLLKCEKIFQFYSDKATAETEHENFLLAKEDYYYIIHALKGSGISTEPRVTELMEQSEFMLEQISNMISGNLKTLADEKNPDNIEEKHEHNNVKTEEKGPATKAHQ